MNKANGKPMILVGAILETLIALFGIVLIILYDEFASAELMTRLGISPETSFRALIWFYIGTILHIVAAIIAYLGIKPQRYLPALVIGVILILYTNIVTDWANASILTAAMNILPGALIAGGALVNRQSLK